MDAAGRLIEIIKEEVGGEIRSNSKVGEMIRRRGVARTAEYMRIAALPRRQWETWPELEELRMRLTKHLRVPGGTRELKPIQAMALSDIYQQRGAFLPIVVGGGKTPISLLAPVIVGAKRPMLLVPADLREKTKRKAIPEWSQHFRMHPALRVVGNSELSLLKNDRMLERYQPDMIILDEAQEYRSKKTGRGRRMIRYLADHPETIVVAMSGSFLRQSLRDIHHLMQWSLGVHNTPLPASFHELSEWADALDEDVPDQKRMAPGALVELCAGGDNVRQGYQRRLRDTPGIVASGAGELDVALRIRKWGVKIPDRLRRMIADVRRNWEDPNGFAIAEATEIWRTARQLALGYWSYWDPPAPRPWLDARREWMIHVRHTLRHNRRGLFTPLAVWNECADLYGSGKADDPRVRAWLPWKEIEPTFKPRSHPVWIDDFMVGAVERWLGQGEGIVWSWHVPLAGLLTERLGVPYYGAGDKASIEILDATGPIIASAHAHYKGKDLQDRWHRNLITSTPSSAERFEQLMGRTHREGQPADTVTFDLHLDDESLMESFRNAQSKARYIEDISGSRQRLNYADITFAVGG